MDTVPLREAQTALPELLDRVEKGEDVVIARDGVPVAKLVRVPAQATGRRQLSQEQKKALEDIVEMSRRIQMHPWRFDRNELYDRP